MPWLAPFGTPVCEPIIESHAPSWQSSRASRSSGSAFTAAQPTAEQPQRVKRRAVRERLRVIEQMSSTA